MSRRSVLASCLLILCFALPADAAGGPSGELPALSDYRAEARAEERSLSWDILRSMLMLLVVLILLGVGVKLLRRFPALTGRGQSSAALQLLERVSLTPKEAICLVRVGSFGGNAAEADLLVVGVSGSGVTLLHRMRASTAESPPRSDGAAVPFGTSAGAPSPRFRLCDLRAQLYRAQAGWNIGEPSRRRGR